MGKIFYLKEWVTVPEAAKRLSTVFEEPVTEADVLRLALDGKLKLSVQFVNHAPALCAHAKPIEQVTYREAPELARFVPASIREKHGELPVSVMVGTQVSASHVAEFGDEVENLHGVYDFPMIGAERLDVEHRYQFLTNGPGVTLAILNGPFVVDSDGRLCQLQERAPEHDIDTSSLSDEVAAVFAAAAERRKKRPLYHADNYYPAASLPDDSTLVVRTRVLAEFEQRVRQDQSPNDRPTGLEGFDSEDPRYPQELDIALQAWLSVRNTPTNGRSAKEMISDWLKQCGYKLTGAAIERISTVCNWDKSGGRPKSD